MVNSTYSVPDWDAIQLTQRITLQNLGDQIGYGRCIQILQNIWAKKIEHEMPIPRQTAELSAGIICVWCHTDSRTGKVLKIESRKKPRKIKL